MLHPSHLSGVLPARITGRIAVTSTGCWEVYGFDNGNGYRRAWLDGKRQYIHRVVYALLVGPIAEDLTIDHLCRNRACCNPRHLEAVSDEVNRGRGGSPPTRNARKAACPTCGGPYSFKGRGDRYCQPCRRRARIANGEITGSPPMAERTHCPLGHPYDAANTYTYIKSNGRPNRMCRTCMAARTRARRERLKAGDAHARDD